MNKKSGNGRFVTWALALLTSLILAIGGVVYGLASGAKETAVEAKTRCDSNEKRTDELQKDIREIKQDIKQLLREVQR